MKVIFLDIDGVLNNRSCYPGLGVHPEFGRYPDPECVEQLNRICVETGAWVVISSTWRAFMDQHQLAACLRFWGATAPLLDVTPLLRTMKDDICLSQPRGIEIQAWLNAHPEVKSFVILDDDSDMVHLTPRLVKTDFDEGLTAAHATRAIRMLSADTPKEAIHV